MEVGPKCNYSILLRVMWRKRMVLKAEFEVLYFEADWTQVKKHTTAGSFQSERDQLYLLTVSRRNRSYQYLWFNNLDSRLQSLEHSRMDLHYLSHHTVLFPHSSYRKVIQK